MKTNWKTTFFGLLAGAAQLLSQGASWKSALSAAAITALGLFASDTRPKQ